MVWCLSGNGGSSLCAKQEVKTDEAGEISDWSLTCLVSYR